MVGYVACAAPMTCGIPTAVEPHEHTLGFSLPVSDKQGLLCVSKITSHAQDAVTSISKAQWCKVHIGHRHSTYVHVRSNEVNPLCTSDLC